MKETAVYSCKISATIANPDGENAGHRAAAQGSDSRKATLEERGLLPGRPHFLWDWEVRDLPGKARSKRDCLVEVYLVSDTRSATLFLFTRFPIAIDQVFVSSD